jgi:glycine hydroxymethyltransferase
MTTLGMGIDEMKEIADLIVKVLCNTQTSLVESTGQPSKSKGETNPQILQQIQERIKTLLHKFPLYPEIDITI